MPDGKTKNKSPGVERAMEILGAIERDPSGLSLDELSDITGVTRSTTYRILNALKAYGMVRGLKGGSYVIGSRVLQMAASVGDFLMDYDYPRIARQHLESAAHQTGETVKISIHDRGTVLVVAGASGHSDQALATVVGRYQPLHAGAASKILLSTYPDDQIDHLFRIGLVRYTDLTLTSKEEMMRELAAIRQQKWSFDPGEYADTINAYGAPITAPSGETVAALSIPFVAGHDRPYHDEIRQAACKTAHDISAALSAL